MSGYTLQWKQDRLPMPLDGSVLRPDTLGKLTSRALGQVPMQIGKKTFPLAELFDITGTSGDTLTLIDPPLLDHLGSQMTGGVLHIQGDAGNDLGSSMQNGRIHVQGNAGDRVGGPSPDQPRGMAGGEITLSGNAGDYLGLMMRRGLIYVQGHCLKSPGYRMLAGTLVLNRGPLDHPGLESRRGTLVCLDPDAKIEDHDCFAPDGVFESPPVLALIFRRLQNLGIQLDPGLYQSRFQLSSGDRHELNKAELWQLKVFLD